MEETKPRLVKKGAGVCGVGENDWWQVQIQVLDFQTPKVIYRARISVGDKSLFEDSSLYPLPCTAPTKKPLSTSEKEQVELFTC